MRGEISFARDPDSLIIFTRHEEEGAFAVELVLRNLPPVDPFVVQWHFPLFQRNADLDPGKLKQAGGRSTKTTAEEVLKCLGDQSLTTGEWREDCESELGIGKTTFFNLRAELEAAGRVQKSIVTRKWERIQSKSRNSGTDFDQ